MEEFGEKRRVCVTGAGGFIASWLVKLLLSKGYFVHGTVRDPCDGKNAHLKKLERASENLQLFKADLLDCESLCAAISGCTGVFHVASPVPPGYVSNPEVEIIGPAVTGTKNVINACLKANVEKVVVMSSLGAVAFNPQWPNDQEMDEQCWSDEDSCKANERWYYLAKTQAERESMEYAKGKLNLVTICPSFVFGPMLQSTMNASSLLLLALLKDGNEKVDDESLPVVDVRDVAEALILAYEKPDAEGRYICNAYVIRTRALVEMLKEKLPDFNYPKSFVKVDGDGKPSSGKLQSLGWKYRPLEDTLLDSVKNYKESGFLG